MFLAIETCLTILCCAVAYVRPQLGDSQFSRLEIGLNSLARRRVLAVVIVGIFALGLRALVLPILPIPAPETHDEFSYLLLSDTLAHGRLANPTHPMWVHFETFHVNWHPTYSSMYYPGQALVLAFGQVVLGHPFWGVWLSGGLMCAAICWALQGWLPPVWAFLGGLLAVVRIGTFSDWVDSYWGGAVAALGGALVFGALPRIKSQCRARDALTMGAGMSLLAITRPYEGLFFCIPITAALCAWAIRADAPPFKIVLNRVVAPALSVLIPVVAALGYYFWRVTGSPFMIPYQVNMRTYGLVYFPWSKIQTVQYQHLLMQKFYRGGAVLGTFYFARQHPLELQFLKALVVWLFYFGPILSMPIIVWLLTRSHRHFRKSFLPDTRFVVILCLFTGLSLMLTIYIGHPQYAAPLTAAFYALILMSLRDLWHWQTHGPSGRFLVRSVPLVCFILFVARGVAPALHLEPKPSWVRTWCSRDMQNLERVRILNELEHLPGNHLVIVRYQRYHDFILDEWVFNNADIDGSKVVWARDMGEEKNRELLRYFSTRHVWLVEPDFKPVALTPYASSQ